VTADEFPDLGATTLPANLFGFITYLNGEPTRLGCTAVVAFVACLTCLNIYRLALEFDAEEDFAFKMMVALRFGPAFLMYKCAMFKDGLVAFFVIGALGSAFRLARRFSILHAVIGMICLFALWQVRFYLIFVTLGPLLVGVTGINAKSITR